MSQPSTSAGPVPAQVRPAGQRTSLREVAELTPEELAALPENSRREYLEFQSRATTSRSKRALANYEEKKAKTQAQLLARRLRLEIETREVMRQLELPDTPASPPPERK